MCLLTGTMQMYCTYSLYILTGKQDAQYLCQHLRQGCCTNVRCAAARHHAVAAGEELLMSADPDSDLEHLIKGGPFELTMAANQLGSNLFGIHSANQVYVITTRSDSIMPAAGYVSFYWLVF